MTTLSSIKLSTIVFGFLLLAASYCNGQDDLKVDSTKIFKSSHSGQEVFDRLNRNFGALNCNDNSANYWLKTYSKNSNGFFKHLQSALPLLDYVSREVEKINLPSEYALVPFIESHYNPAAKSKLGPAGLWQMISNTAKHNGVIISAKYDGRYSPIDSTQGALNYLTKLTRKFSDWQTTLMAYNAGGTRMRISLSAQGLKNADAQKKLPRGLALHTYAYALKVKAIACLISEPDRYGIKLPNSYEFTPLQVVTMGRGFVNLDEIMKSYDISIQELISLNPSYKKQVPYNNAPGNILVPQIPVEEDISMYDQGN